MIGAVSGETVVVVRPGRKPDGYGGETFDWDKAQRFTVKRCGVAPYQGEELDRQARQGQLEDWVLFGPYNMDINVHDRVEVRGRLFSVAGPPRQWRSPLSGRRFGTQVDLKRVEG